MIFPRLLNYHEAEDNNIKYKIKITTVLPRSHRVNSFALNSKRRKTCNLRNNSVFFIWKYQSFTSF